MLQITFLKSKDSDTASLLKEILIANRSESLSELQMIPFGEG